MADVKIEDTPNRAPVVTDLLPFLLTEEHMTVTQLITLIKLDATLAQVITDSHTHSNKVSVLDNLTNSGSGLVITTLERADIVANALYVFRNSTTQTIATATGTIAFNTNTGLKGIIQVTGNVVIDLQNVVSGDEGILKFTDGTGFDATIQRAGSAVGVLKVASGGTVAGAAETLVSTGSTITDVIVWEYDGTNLIYNHTTE